MKWRIIAPAFGGFYRATGYLKSNSKASPISSYICAKEKYSELTKTSTALARLAVTCVLSAARRLVLIFVNPL